MHMRSALILMAANTTDSVTDRALLWTPIAGHSSMARILMTCESSPELHATVILIDAPYLSRAETLLEDLHLKKPVILLTGNNERLSMLSTALATLKTLLPDLDAVAIHDAYRPLITEELLQTGFAAVHTQLAVCAAVPVKETIKQVVQGMIQATLDRSKLWLLQSPQMFVLDELESALQTPEARDGFPDETTLFARLGKSVTIFPGSYNNLRLCGPADLLLAEALLQG